ncbi:MAG TPA: CHASE domain-containing protein, partial [Vicinamibacterales bacterium]|nr:CHASE domain-containing protein [Vicinamibacterales bacterium]
MRVVLVNTKIRPTAVVRRLLLWRSVPYGLFILASGLSIAASWYLSSTAASTAETQARTEFITDAHQTRRQIQVGLDTYFEVVRAGAVLLSADNEINGMEFRRFVSGLQLRERYPGMEGIGFAQRVRQRDLSGFFRTIDLDGTRVRLWPGASRSEYYPTIFLEPRDSHRTAFIGFDLASEPAVEETMVRARDTGQPEVSSKLTATDAWDETRGNFVLVIAVYRLGVPLPTLDARRRALVGFVFSAFRSEQLLQSIVTSISPSLVFDVYDGTAAMPEALLSKANPPGMSGRYRSSEVIEVGGREWLIAANSIADPPSLIPPAARQTLFGGLALSFMLFLITRAQVHAWETASRHEAELRASAQALRESESQAQAANRAKDEFLGTLSHELRTPLNVVLGWISILRLGPLTEERRAHALEIIERNARHQAELIDDLLDVSRIVTGKVRLQLRPVAVASIVSTVVDSVRPSADAKGIEINMVSATESSTIRGDPDRLHQIAWNLVSNAIKFTPAGGSVSVELTRIGEDVALTVRDTGVGIAPDFLPHVFERFRQADSSTTRTHGGVGLGLAIARHLVDLHGGTIEAHSEGLGQGAEFIVKFPAVAVSVTSAPAPLLAMAPLAAPRLDSVRVLVVDDDAHTRDLLTEALSMTGARVTSADSARHALDRLSKETVDIIVSDIAMPDEDGFWLMQRVRALPGEVAKTPAIALTALARTEDRVRVMDAGYQMHLAKPVQLGELQAALATLVAQRHRAAFR